MISNFDSPRDTSACINVVDFPMQDLMHTLIDNHVHSHKHDTHDNHSDHRNNHQLYENTSITINKTKEKINYFLCTNTTKSS